MAMLVTNIPLMWSLFRDIFPGLKKWADGGESDFRAETWPRTSRGTKSITFGSSNRRSKNMNLQSVERQRNWKEMGTASATSTESREGMNPRDLDLEDRDGRIHVKKDTTIDVEEATDEEQSHVWDWHGNPNHVSLTEVAGGVAGRQ